MRQTSLKEMRNENSQMSLPVLITYSNYGYAPFAKNLLLNLCQTARNHKVHFYCLDTDIKTYLEALDLSGLDIQFELVTSELSRGFEAYNSAGYMKITHTKMGLIKRALERYQWVHFIDCDVVCVREPTAEYWAQWADYDIVFQYDAGFYSATRPEWPFNHIWACTGNTLFRNTAGTHALIDKIIEYQGRYPRKNDQECLYQYFQDLGIKDISKCPLAKLYTFPYEEFTNGFWVNRDIGDVSRTYFFHANHVSGSSAKLRLLRKIGMLYI
jgi:hypothetical protein